jgi:myo-inositol-1(or 4)-monophosphatase
MKDLDLLPVVVEAVEAAGRLLLGRPAPPSFATFAEFKAVFDAINDPSEMLLRDRLGAVCPGIEWVEEMDTEIGTSGEAWVVDAVDGAVQYIQRLPQWSVSVALVRDGHPVLAVLHSAWLRETYTAVRGEGAFLNDTPISPSTKANVGLTVVGTSQPPFPGHQPDAINSTGAAMIALLPAVGAIRNLGPTSWQVADVASGRLDAFWEYGRDAGNLIAGSLLAIEAGAVVTDTSGRPWGPSSNSFLVAPAELHRQLVALLP